MKSKDFREIQVSSCGYRDRSLDYGAVLGPTLTVGIEPVEDFGDAAGRKTDAGVGCPSCTSILIHCCDNAHCQQRANQGQRRFRAFVRVNPFWVQPVVAPAGGIVVKR